MKTLPNNIVLRPRFQMEVSSPKDSVLDIVGKAQRDPFIVKRLDEHIFIKFNEKYNTFWSPQLHIEIHETDSMHSILYGVYGPNPTLWTFFMFLHFGVATFFVLLAVWAYSNAALNRPYALHMGGMVLLVVLWFVLYAFGRSGKRKGKPQMQELHQFMVDTLSPLS